MPMKNSIYLRRKCKLLVPTGISHLPLPYLATALKNMERLGYTFSQPLIERLQTLSIEDFTTFFQQLEEDVKKLVGDHVRYRPMYQNFPQQLMEESQASLYVNAIIHYLTLSLPIEEVKKRLPLLDRSQLTVIGLGYEEELEQIFWNLVQSKTSLSETDKDDLSFFIQEYQVLDPLVQLDIPLKENIALVAGLLFTSSKMSPGFFSKHIKTATDVLRVATALSGGDISLSRTTPFRKFTRAQRRFILGLLENCHALEEDMLRYKNRWIRLGEILHPTEYKQRFPRCADAFYLIRNNQKIETFNSKVEQALLHRQLPEAIELLSTRPGELARRLDHMIRLSANWQPIVYAFEQVIDQVSSPVLLQVMTHFANRHTPQVIRTFFPKGNVAKVQVSADTLAPLTKEIGDSITSICQKEFIHRFSQLPPLGYVYIDERLRHYTVPFSQRSAQKALCTITRGSKLDLPAGDTIRFFTWWREGVVNQIPTDRVDVDLSAVMYDHNWNDLEHISYTNLVSASFKAYHSGDITTAPQGACEFIDIDLSAATKAGARYISMSLHSFTSHPYCDLPECFAGWMMRQHPNSGEIFEPSTVQNKIDITADTTICIPVIIDVETRQVIWTDLALTTDPIYSNNVENNRNSMLLMGKAMTNLIKPNLYDLFLLHALARGTLVDSPDRAQSVFSVNSGVTPFDTDKIMSDYL
ncbi:cytoplasmic protein [Brevibacillus laterosporus DSM 25]|nr:cytoplasmic protein [Brevibacillus laterosporus DSM 25]